jgi:pilus assembly protein CpaC
MRTRCFTTFCHSIVLLVLFVAPRVACGQDSDAWFESKPTSPFKVESAKLELELPEGSSRTLKFEHSIPKFVVDSPDIIQATPISGNEFIITGLRVGLAHITVADPKQNHTIIRVNVTVDVRPLEIALGRTFPTSNVKIVPMRDGVMLLGTVARADDIQNVMAVAQNYFPTTVINQLSIDGSQTVSAQVRVYEVSRTKLRNLGVDWSVAGRNLNIVSGFADVISSLSPASSTQDNLRIGVINDSTTINTFINFLEQRNVAKLMSQPTLTAQNGRAAEFLSGGEIPYQVAQGLGNATIEFRPFGTKLDMVPIIHGQGEMTLEIRAEVSEVANDLNAGTPVPGFRVRRVNTAVPMRAGQTLALAGDYREKVESEVRGAPGLMNKGAWGIPFRNTHSEENETELVFLITPQFVQGVNANQFVGPFPGQTSKPPSNRELMINGHVEVPRCPDDGCPTSSPFTTGQNAPLSPAYPASGVPHSNGNFERPEYQSNGPSAANNRFGFPTSTPAPREGLNSGARGLFHSSSGNKSSHNSAGQGSTGAQNRMSDGRFDQYPTGGQWR